MWIGSSHEAASRPIPESLFLLVASAYWEVRDLRWPARYQANRPVVLPLEVGLRVV